jgi:hypothetical protein
MIKTTAWFDFRQPVAYDPRRKPIFHGQARSRLRLLAAALGFRDSDYDVRSNEGGVAVSGEAILHAARLYVQASQSSMGCDAGILFRSCAGRQDHVGGRNHFAPLDLLNHPAALAALIRRNVLLPVP